MNDLIPCNLTPKPVWYVDGWYAPYGTGYVPNDLNQDHSKHTRVREFFDTEEQASQIKIHYGVRKKVTVPMTKPERITGKFNVGQTVKWRGHTGIVKSISSGWYICSFPAVICCPYFSEEELSQE